MCHYLFDTGNRGPVAPVKKRESAQTAMVSRRSCNIIVQGGTFSEHTVTKYATIITKTIMLIIFMLRRIVARLFHIFFSLRPTSDHHLTAIGSDGPFPSTLWCTHVRSANGHVACAYTRGGRTRSKIVVSPAFDVLAVLHQGWATLGIGPVYRFLRSSRP